ncbi:MAG: UDP-3-O-acyl-N-acetylglucosamine deacetylase [Pirellulaceae bacterium]
MRYSLRQQHTIAEPVRVEGFGYWSGLDVRVEFRPAAPHTGIRFVRSDLGEPVSIPALVGHRVEMPRRTTLAANGATIEMVEHVMAALAGLQIDNCEIWVDRPELPGCDGSSGPFVQALLSTERIAQPALRESLVITSTTRVGDDQCWVQASPEPSGTLRLAYVLDYGVRSPIGRQAFELSLSPHSFCAELAAARTFILQPEAEWLRNQGLGGRVTCTDLLVFDERGPVENVLRFPDECVRHKTLDLVGDLALAGCDLQGRITAFRSGHRLNAHLVQELLMQDQFIRQRCRVA